MKSLAAGLKSAEWNGAKAERNGADLKTAVTTVDISVSVNSSRLGRSFSRSWLELERSKKQSVVLTVHAEKRRGLCAPRYQVVLERRQSCVRSRLHGSGRKSVGAS